MKIFIQIASYRDPQLSATLRNCLRNARHPERLHFCIAHQYDAGEDISEFTGDHPSGARFTILEIPYQESQGACWARHQIQQNYQGEQFTLHLDSHHRFAKDWDVTCVNMLRGLQAKGFSKPLLTAYLPSFDPDLDPQQRVQEPWRMIFDRFTPEGVVFFLPVPIPNWRVLSQPIPARFLSAHFTFTLGRHCLEVPHDPDYYFHGEEISLAVRSFTHGYDLFHPHKVVAWHEYTRKGRVKHWDDDKKWHVRNTACLKRNRCLLGMELQDPDIDFGEFGLGSVRTFDQYQEYAGIRFHDRAVQEYTLSSHLPPNPPPTDPKALWKYPLKRTFSLPDRQVPEQDYDFWCVAFHNENGKEIFRKDAIPSELQRVRSSKDNCYKIERTFYADVKPARFVVWPHSVSKGWCGKITIPL